jgi:hypothetical protein
MRRITAVAVTTITIDGEAQVIFPNAHPVPPSHDSTVTPLSYTIDGAVAATGISDRQFRRYIAEGVLPVKKNGTTNIILRDDLIAFLRNLPEARTEV